MNNKPVQITTRSVSANDKFVQFNARKKKERKYNKDSVKLKTLKGNTVTE